MAINPSSLTPGFDTNQAATVTCLKVDEHEVLATLSLGHLLQLVPDPQQFEEKRYKAVLENDPALVDLAEQREVIQRYFTGAKKSNLPRYADFLLHRIREQLHRGTPPICLGSPQSLRVLENPDGTAKVAIPFGRRFLAVDGETQRAAWQSVYKDVYDLIKAEIVPEDILDTIKVPVEIHHGLSVDELQSLFYERNVLGAKVNVNEAIAKDQRDPATQICRAILAMPLQGPSGSAIPTSMVVQQQSRQVGKNSPHWITLSALRTLVVTAILGRPGLQYGAKPIPLPEGVEFEVLKAEVAGLVHEILERFAGDFANKEGSLIGSPALMAGIGIAVNRAVTTVPNTSGKPPLAREQLMDTLSAVKWDKFGPYWDGIATRKTPKGVTTVAGPKEVGYAVADAIDGSNPQTAARVRGLPEPAVATAPAFASASV